MIRVTDLIKDDFIPIENDRERLESPQTAGS